MSEESKRQHPENTERPVGTLWGSSEGNAHGAAPTGSYSSEEIAILNYDRELTLERNRVTKNQWEGQRVIMVNREGNVSVCDVVGFTDDALGMQEIGPRVRNLLTGVESIATPILYVFTTMRLESILLIPRKYRVHVLHAGDRTNDFATVIKDGQLEPELNFQQLMDTLYINNHLTGRGAETWLAQRTEAMNEKKL